MTSGSSAPADSGIVRGILLIVLSGAVLGVTFNAIGLESRRPWGLPWVGVDPLAAMPTLDELSSGSEAAEPEASTGGYTDISDPMAVGAVAGATEVPEIPALDRPIQIEIDAVKKLFDAEAALFVDAREPDEFAEGHIPGAVNLPYDEVSSEPERLEQLDQGDRAIVVYCGGGACELSLSLAWELIYAGKSRVTVFMGGFPDWTDAGYPVGQGG